MHLEGNKGLDLLGVISKKDRDQMEKKRLTILDMNKNLYANAPLPNADNKVS